MRANSMLLPLVLAFYSYAAHCQPGQELFGFRLGQAKDEVRAKLGAPVMISTLTDQSQVEFYYTSSDSIAYVGFQYLSSQPSTIYAIQLSGYSSGYKFQGLTLGDKKQLVWAKLGTPDQVSHQQFHEKEATILSYPANNLSVLFWDDKLGSIRIWGHVE